MPPPKKMTANPLRPARHRPGKPGAAAVESSSEEEDSENEEAEEQQEERTKIAKPQPSATSFPKQTSQISSGLRKVDIAGDRSGAVIIPKTEVSDEEEGSSEEDSEEESGSEESSEEEESSSEDEASRRKMLRPVFIRKGARNGTATADIKSEDQKFAEEETRKKARTHEMLQEQLEKKALAKAEEQVFWDDDKVVDDVDDTDGVDPQAEYMAWTIRALKRQKRDEEERLRAEKEREEVERWRNLPEEQREAEIQERLQKQKDDRESRGKIGFLQKYHHGGAFYQDTLEEAGLAGRDVMGARFEDEVADRSSLPQFMQIRDMTKLGRKGRTRYKDLRSEDTGRFGDFPDNRRPGKGEYGVDDRFKPDHDREGPGATGANASSLGERRRPEGQDTRDPKRQRID